MRLLSFVVCLIAVAGVAACTQSAPTNSAAPNAAATPQAPVKVATPDPLAAARGNYAKDCVACHGDSGEGGLVKVEDKKLKVPSFKSDHAMKKSDADFIKQITTGGDGMPSFKAKLDDAQKQDLVKLIRKEFQGK